MTPSIKRPILISEMLTFESTIVILELMKHGIPVQTRRDGTVLRGVSIFPDVSGFLCVTPLSNPDSTGAHSDPLEGAGGCQVCFSAGS